MPYNARHCTTPGGTSSLGYKSNGIPQSVQWNSLAEFWFPSGWSTWPLSKDPILSCFSNYHSLPCIRTRCSLLPYSYHFTSSSLPSVCPVSISQENSSGWRWEGGYGDWVSAERELGRPLSSLFSPSSHSEAAMGQNTSNSQFWESVLLRHPKTETEISNTIPMGRKAQRLAGSQQLVGGVDISFLCAGGHLPETWGSGRIKSHVLNVCSFRTEIVKVRPVDQIYPAACFYK